LWKFYQSCICRQERTDEILEVIHTGFRDFLRFFDICDMAFGSHLWKNCWDLCENYICVFGQGSSHWSHPDLESGPDSFWWRSVHSTCCCYIFIIIMNVPVRVVHMLTGTLHNESLKCNLYKNVQMMVQCDCNTPFHNKILYGYFNMLRLAVECIRKWWTVSLTVSSLHHSNKQAYYIWILVYEVYGRPRVTVLVFHTLSALPILFQVLCCVDLTAIIVIQICLSWHCVTLVCSV